MGRLSAYRRIVAERSEKQLIGRAYLPDARLEAYISCLVSGAACGNRPHSRGSSRAASPPPRPMSCDLPPRAQKSGWQQQKRRPGSLSPPLSFASESDSRRSRNDDERISIDFAPIRTATPTPHSIPAAHVRARTATPMPPEVPRTLPPRPRSQGSYRGRQEDRDPSTSTSLASDENGDAVVEDLELSFGEEQLSLADVTDALQVWGKAVRKHFGGGLSSQDLARCCTKWLALGWSTTDSCIRWEADLSEACEALGFGADAAEILASQLWRLRDEGRGLPVSVLLKPLESAAVMAANDLDPAQSAMKSKDGIGEEPCEDCELCGIGMSWSFTPSKRLDTLDEDANGEAEAEAESTEPNAAESTEWKERAAKAYASCGEAAHVPFALMRSLLILRSPSPRCPSGPYPSYSPPASPLPEAPPPAGGSASASPVAQESSPALSPLTPERSLHPPVIPPSPGDEAPSAPPKPEGAEETENSPSNIESSTVLSDSDSERRLSAQSSNSGTVRKGCLRTGLPHELTPSGLIPQRPNPALSQRTDQERMRQAEQLPASKASTSAGSKDATASAPPSKRQGFASSFFGRLRRLA